jgi:hypothetical protein
MAAQSRATPYPRYLGIMAAALQALAQIPSPPAVLAEPYVPRLSGLPVQSGTLLATAARLSLGATEHLSVALESPLGQHSDRSSNNGRSDQRPTRSQRWRAGHRSRCGPGRSHEARGPSARGGHAPDFCQTRRIPPGVADLGNGCAEVAGEEVGGGDDAVAGLYLDGAVTAGGLHELTD